MHGVVSLLEDTYWLSERDFNWELTVDHLALIYDTGSKQELRSRFEFGKPSLQG